MSLGSGGGYRGEMISILLYIYLYYICDAMKARCDGWAGLGCDAMR
jgi:hypothetical protein